MEIINVKMLKTKSTCRSCQAERFIMSGIYKDFIDL